MHKEKLFIEGAWGKNPSRLLMLFSANSFFFFCSLSKHWEVYIQKENPIELAWAFFFPGTPWAAYNVGKDFSHLLIIKSSAEVKDIF